MSFNQKLQATFQGLIFLVTAVYAIVAGLQWWALRNQVAESRQAARVQARLTRRALAETAESNRLTQESNQISRWAAQASGRAWIVPEVPAYGIKLAAVIPMVVTLPNYGNAPAFNALSITDWSFSPDELPGADDLDPTAGSLVLPPNAPEPRSIHFVIGGRSAPTWPLGIRPDTLSDREIAEIRAGARKLYLGGIVRYDDPYGKDRETRWCTVYAVPSGDFMPCPPGVGVSHLR